MGNPQAYFLNPIWYCICGQGTLQYRFTSYYYCIIVGLLNMTGHERVSTTGLQSIISSLEKRCVIDVTLRVLVHCEGLVNWSGLKVQSSPTRKCAIG